jgi:hypothetical protein
MTGESEVAVVEEPAEPAPHAITLAVWAVPDAVAAGERFGVKIGAKSAAASALTGCRVDVFDPAGELVASGHLGDTPWPGTDALHWTELTLTAPPREVTATWSVRLDASELERPHADATASFSIAVVRAAEHTVTVRVMADATPIDAAEIRLGPYRATTDVSGTAAVRIGKGRYDLAVWKAGYDVPATSVDVQADAVIEIVATPLPEDDPDAYWTRA